MLVGILVALAVLGALAARASADPEVDELDEIDEMGADADPELAEAVAQPEVIDDPTADESIAQLESLGVAGAAGAEDWLEAQARHQRPSPWGRLDLELSLLHRDDAPGIAAPHAFDELWLELVWRR